MRSAQVVQSDGQAAAAAEQRPAKRPRASSAEEKAAGPKIAISSEEFQCPLCCRLLFEPVTTSCGKPRCRDPPLPLRYRMLSVVRFGSQGTASVERV